MCSTAIIRLVVTSMQIAGAALLMCLGTNYELSASAAA